MPDHSGVIRRGMLWKKRDNSNTWKLRLFELLQDRVDYYIPNRDRVRGSFPLDRIVMVARYRHSAEGVGSGWGEGLMHMFDDREGPSHTDHLLFGIRLRVVGDKKGVRCCSGGGCVARVTVANAEV